MFCLCGVAVAVVHIASQLKHYHDQIIHDVLSAGVRLHSWYLGSVIKSKGQCAAGRAYNVHAPEPAAPRGADIPQLPRQGGCAAAAPPQIQPPICARLPTGILCLVAVFMFLSLLLFPWVNVCRGARMHHNVGKVWLLNKQGLGGMGQEVKVIGDNILAQVFAKVLVCNTLATATRVGGETGLTCVTIDGDIVGKKGTLTGGFVDASR